MAHDQVADEGIAHRQAQSGAHIDQGVGFAILAALEMRLDVAAGQGEQRPLGHAQQNARCQQQAVAVHGRRQKGHHAPQQQPREQAAAHAEQRRAEWREHKGRNTVADHEGRGQQALTRSVVGCETDVRQKVVIGDEDRDIDPVHVGNGDDHEQRDHAPPAQRA